MDLVHIIDGLIGVVVLGFGYWASTLAAEVKRQGILLSKTREETASTYASRAELRDELRAMTESFIRLEQKIERLFERAE